MKVIQKMILPWIKKILIFEISLCDECKKFNDNGREYSWQNLSNLDFNSFDDNENNCEKNRNPFKIIKKKLLKIINIKFFNKLLPYLENY